MRLGFVTVLVYVVALGVSGAPASAWRGRTVYQLLTDRFNNPSGAVCPDLDDYCGGTFSGVSAQLDYIAGMGFDAIWISPIVANTPGGYHGYWAQNLSLVNPHFGSAESLAALVSAAHARGMWVMLDVVANHMGIAPFASLSPFDSGTYYHDC
jgi:alpha-amylase